MVSAESDKSFPLLNEKAATERMAIYLCKNFSCLQPVFSVPDLMSLIANGTVNNY